MTIVELFFDPPFVVLHPSNEPSKGWKGALILGGGGRGRQLWTLEKTPRILEVQTTGKARPGSVARPEPEALSRDVQGDAKRPETNVKTELWATIIHVSGRAGPFDLLFEFPQSKEE